MKDTFELKTATGETKEIHMSYGLLDVLCRTVGEMDGAALLALDNDIRAQMIIEILSERDEKGSVTTPISPFSIKFPLEQVSEMLGWAQEHIFDFFVKAATKSRAVGEQHRKALEALKAI